MLSDSIRRMSNTAPPPGFPPGPSPQMPWPPRGPAQWPIVVMFAITLVAVAAAVAAWLRPMPETKSAVQSAPTFTDQQVTDAKSNVCSAYAKIHHAVDTNATRTLGGNPTAQLSVAVNMRQVYVAGSAHLLTTLADELATPSDLATAAQKIARLFQALVLEGLFSDPTAPTSDEINATGQTIQSLCK
jgi:hypothetical protein